MPAYNFMQQFALLVEMGQKRQTIRAQGKRRHACPGECLQLYTGQRTKACRKLVKPDPVCSSVQRVDLVWGCSGSQRDIQIYVDGTCVDSDIFATADGFENVDQFKDFFLNTHGIPFEGVLIKW